MLTVFVYKSKKVHNFSESDLQALIKKSIDNNEIRRITGILLYSGDYFLQIIEGDNEEISKLYDKILSDERHEQLVEIITTQIPNRYFSNLGMSYIDIRGKNKADLISNISELKDKNKNSPYYDRILKIVSAFHDGLWGSDELYLKKEMGFSEIHVNIGSPEISFYKGELGYKFSVQPILNTLGNSISSYEFLLRSHDGGSPQQCFASLHAQDIYEFDLVSKKSAFEWASRFVSASTKISINLLPMTLVKIPDLTETLTNYLSMFNLQPENIIIEITEEEAISHIEEFTDTIKELHVAGFGIAIDDFGAGFAGLSLITKFQPEIIKIDRLLVNKIYQDGPRQMIVKSVVNLCRPLGIEIVAEGIEEIEEWTWLKNAGVNLFQGFLFSKPSINDVLKIKVPNLMPFTSL